MSAPDEATVKLWIDAATAIGTVAVAIIAIWGEEIRRWLRPAELQIEPVDEEGIRGHVAVLTSPHGQNRAMWYVLKVVNKKRWRTSSNCRVLLKAISRRGPDGAFRPETFPVPRQFWWAPSESTPTEITLGKEHVFDFGFITDGPDARFTPTLYSQPHNFPGLVRKGESVRFSIEVDAENFSSPHYQVFEVAWDGTWSEDSAVMARHLTINEIKATSAQ